MSGSHRGAELQAEDTAGKLRIALLAQRPQRRGAEVAAFELGAELARFGCVVCRIYLYPYAGATSLPLDPGDRVLEGRANHLFERLPGLHPSLLQRLRRSLRAFAPDVVQAHGARTVKYTAAARRFDAADGWAFIYRNIGDPRRWAGGWRGAAYRRLVMPEVDGVIGVSAATLDAALAHYRLDGVPAARIPRGIDPSAFLPGRRPEEVRATLGAPARAPVLLFVGSLTAEKRVDRVIAWAAGARRDHPGLRLWLVGDGPSRADLERRAHAAGPAGTVVFAGAQERVGDFLAAADLLVLGSDTEGLPGVVLEAGAAGLPAVATRVGGVSEAIEDGVTGLLVAPEDEAAGIAAVSGLLADPGRRREMGRAARRRVERCHDPRSVALSYLDFYHRVLERRRGTRAG